MKDARHCGEAGRTMTEPWKSGPWQTERGSILSIRKKDVLHISRKDPSRKTCRQPVHVASQANLLSKGTSLKTPLRTSGLNKAQAELQNILQSKAAQGVTRMQVSQNTKSGMSKDDSHRQTALFTRGSTVWPRNFEMQGRAAGGAEVRGPGKLGC